MTNILILDNDECLGYFSLLNGVYNGCIRYLSKLHLCNNENIKLFDEYFSNFAVELLLAGYARNNLANFFEKVKKLKTQGVIHKVVMMTSNYRYIRKRYKGQFDWVNTMRNILEKYANVNTLYPSISIYDFDYSCRNDEENSIIAKDNATVKKISNIIQKLQITNYYSIHKIICIDDRIKNIDFEDIFDAIRVITIPVRPYHSLLSKTVFYAITSKYELLFEKLQINNFKQICIINFNHDVKQMGMHGNNLFTSIKNDNDLDIDLHNLFNNTI
jgi:hypothetical protein